ncbi:septation protein IspZ [Candidatus Liberibacter africanus]|uniref:Inner membrane-spanning protein YciB n=1 Tax=Candidatus Liberibacter africanus PTSAPSY TaxID=1277257 RepID=A0A0G3I2B6_LIBAF|nr:septation protein IspZ [Candidatus Liberibacter africanus]AKK20006.1 intracellular septation protein A [Candidatus Liberibacter africanus PTSAPSY]QTP63835.1 septation protein IspZ [Candidatus Liberibacter africanus]
MSTLQSQNKTVYFLLGFSPGIVFWLCNMYGGKLFLYFPILSRLGGTIFVSTLLFMALTIISLGIFWIFFHEIRMVPVVSGICVLLFGGLTIWFRDESFIKMKPTFFYSLFSIVLFLGYFFEKSFIRLIFSQVIWLDPIGWRKITIRWAYFFLLLAFINEAVWRNFSTETWIFFKTIGTFPIFLIFGITQINIIKKHSLPSGE